MKKEIGWMEADKAQRTDDTILKATRDPAISTPPCIVPSIIIRTTRLSRGLTRSARRNDNCLTGELTGLAPHTTLTREREMAISIVTHPVTTFRALAIREPQQTPLTLPRRITPTDMKRSGIACVMVPSSARPCAVEAAYWVLLPRLDACKGTRIDPNIRVLVTTLEAKTHSTVHAAPFDIEDCRRVLDVSRFKDNTIADTKDVGTTSSVQGTGILLINDVPGCSMTRHAS